ncbi:MAG: hypothetical protein FWE72_02865 [Spirochaetaceae bacterium]|nr:hypothetical protein [Spirochaetaceae bacterium]
MRKIAVVVLFCFINSLIFSADNTYDDLIAEEYDTTAFPQILKDIRRAEIILVGSYPLTVFFSKLGLDFYDYAASGFDNKNAPSMLGGAGEGDKSTKDVERVLITALCVSAGVAVLDFVIGKIKAKGKKKNANKQTIQNRRSQPVGNTD